MTGVEQGSSDQREESVVTSFDADPDVDPAKPAAAQAPSSSSETRCRRLFIGGLSWDTSDDKFRQYFEQFGPIEESIIMRDKMTGQSRGFGFVTFQSADPVQMVLSQSLELDGRQIDPKLAVRKEEMDKRNTTVLPPRETTDRKIFVGSISPEVTQDSFKEYFESFGPIQEAVVMKGYGFVRFQEQSSVEAVLSHPEHTIMGHKVEPQRAVHRRGSERRPERRDDYGYGAQRGPQSDRYGSHGGRGNWGPNEYREPHYPRRDPYDYRHDHDRYGPYDSSRTPGYDRRAMYESRYAPEPYDSRAPAGSPYDQYADYEPPYSSGPSTGRHGYYADSSYSDYPPAVQPHRGSYATAEPPYEYNDRSYTGSADPYVGAEYGRDSYSAAPNEPQARGGSYPRGAPPAGQSRAGSRYDPYPRT